MNTLKKELKKALVKKLIQDAVLNSLKESVRWELGRDFHEKYKGTKVEFKGDKYEYTQAHGTLEEDYGDGWCDVDSPKIIVTIAFVLCDLNDDEKVKVAEAKKEWGGWSKEYGPVYYHPDGEKELFIILGYKLTFQQIQNILKGQDNLPFNLKYQDKF